METTKYALLDHRYLIHSLLGEGGFATVKRGVDLHSKPRQSYALKIIKHSKLHYGQQEINVLKALQGHPHIINLIDMYIDTEYRKKTGHVIRVMALVLEYVPSPTLHQYILFQGKFPEQIARKFFQDIILFLEYLHNEAGITHGDIKLENILLDSHFNLKFIDFGFVSLIKGPLSNAKLYHPVGTPGYMAPEIYENKGYSGVSADFFAAGVSLFCMVSGMEPFGIANAGDPLYRLLIDNKGEDFWARQEARMREREGEIQGDFFSEGFRSLMDAMLGSNEKARLSVGEIKEHEYYKGEVASEEEIVEEFKKRKGFTETMVKKVIMAKKQQRRKEKEERKKMDAES